MMRIGCAYTSLALAGCLGVLCTSTDAAQQGDDFAVVGLRCSAGPAHISCSAATVNARPGIPVQWEWKLDTRMVTGSGPKLELDGVSAGKHSVVCYARNGNWLALDSVNVDVPAGGASPAGAPASVPGGPTAKPPTGPSAVIASDGVPVPIFTLSRTDPKATLYARCAQLYYAMAIIWYVTMSEDEDVGLGRPEDGTVLGPQAGSTLAVLTLILGALCRSAGVDLNKDPPAARTLASGGEAGGKALLRVDRGALRVTGQQPGLEWQVETPAGRVDAAGLSDFTVGYSTKHRRVVAIAQAGSLTLTPAQAGAAAVRVPPGGRVQWELGGGTPASGVTSTPGASGAPAVPGFAGRWKTTWGDWGQITLETSGNRVWGFYGGDGTQATADGVMEGTVSGRTARLRWQVRNGQLWGGAMFVLSPDGTTMTGSRNDYREPEFAQFKWNAERVR